MVNMAMLDNVEHHDLRVIQGHSEQFGDNLNEVAVFANELSEVHREFPVYFRKESSGFQAVALLGFDPGENLFLEDGRWTGHYVPAMLDRGPFAIGRKAVSDDREDLTVWMDLDHPRVSRTDGAPLFFEHGGFSPHLQRYIERLKVIHSGVAHSRAMFEAFATSGILAPVNLTIKLSSFSEYILPDVFSISADALGGLEPSKLHELHQAGFLSSVYFIVNSIGNISKLVDMKWRKRKAIGH